MRSAASKNAERALGEAAISQEITYNMLYPEYEGFQLRTDGMSQDVGVKSALMDKTYLENNVQITGKNGEDFVTINNESYSDLVIPKESTMIELQLACPTFVFTRGSLINQHTDHTNEPVPHATSDAACVMHSFTTMTLPDVVCHRSMWPLRCIWKRELIWSGTVLFDSTETGISEICWNIGFGLMGESYDRDWWQERLPTPIYEPKESVYAKTHVYAISSDEFPAFDSAETPADLRCCGLKVKIPYYALQAPDLTYAGKYAQNRTQTKMTCHIGYLVGPYTFLTHNTHEVPFCEHDFVGDSDPDNLQYHIPRTDQLSTTPLPGWLDKYLGLYIDTTKFSPYVPYNPTQRDAVSTLRGPTVVGLLHPNYGHNWIYRQAGLADAADGKKTAGNKDRYMNNWPHVNPVNAAMIDSPVPMCIGDSS